MKKIILNDLNNIKNILNNTKLNDLKDDINKTINLLNNDIDTNIFNNLLKIADNIYKVELNNNKNLQDISFDILLRSINNEIIDNNNVKILLSFLKNGINNKKEDNKIKIVQILNNINNTNLFNLIDSNNIKKIILISFLISETKNINIINIVNIFLIQFFNNYLLYLKDNNDSEFDIFSSIIIELLDSIKSKIFTNSNTEKNVIIYNIFDTIFKSLNNFDKKYVLEFYKYNLYTFLIESLNDINNNDISKLKNILYFKFLLKFCYYIIIKIKDMEIMSIINSIWLKLKKNKLYSCYIKNLIISLIVNDDINIDILLFINDNKVLYFDYIIFSQDYDATIINKNISLINDIKFETSNNTSLFNTSNDNNDILSVKNNNIIKEYQFIDILLLEKIIDSINIIIYKEIKNIDISFIIENIFLTIINVPLFKKTDDLLNLKNSLIQKLIQINGYYKLEKNNNYIIRYLYLEIKNNFNNNSNIYLFSLFNLILNIIYCLNNYIKEIDWKNIVNIIIIVKKYYINNKNIVNNQFNIIYNSFEKIDTFLCKIDNNNIDYILYCIIDIIIDNEKNKINSTLELAFLNNIIIEILSLKDDTKNNILINNLTKLHNDYKSIDNLELFKNNLKQIFFQYINNFDVYNKDFIIICQTILKNEDISFMLSLFKEIIDNKGSQLDNTDWKYILEYLLNLFKNITKNQAYSLYINFINEKISQNFINKFDKDNIYLYFNLIKIYINNNILLNKDIYYNIEIIINIVDIYFLRKYNDETFLYEIFVEISVIQEHNNFEIRNCGFEILSNIINCYGSLINYTLFDNIFIKLFFKTFDKIYEIYINLLKDQENNNDFNDIPEYIMIIKEQFYENKINAINDKITHDSIKYISKQYEGTIKLMINCFYNLLNIYLKKDFKHNDVLYNKIFEKIICLFRFNNKEIFYEAIIVIIMIYDLNNYYFNNDKKVIILLEIKNLVKKDFSQGQSINYILNYFIDKGFEYIINNGFLIDIFLDIIVETLFIKINCKEFSTYNYNIQNNSIKLLIMFLENINNINDIDSYLKYVDELFKYKNNKNSYEMYNKINKELTILFKNYSKNKNIILSKYITNYFNIFFIVDNNEYANDFINLFNYFNTYYFKYNNNNYDILNNIIELIINNINKEDSKLIFIIDTIIKDILNNTNSNTIIILNKFIENLKNTNNNNLLNEYKSNKVIEYEAEINILSELDNNFDINNITLILNDIISNLKSYKDFEAIEYKIIIYLQKISHNINNLTLDQSKNILTLINKIINNNYNKSEKLLFIIIKIQNTLLNNYFN